MATRPVRVSPETDAGEEWEDVAELWAAIG